MSRLTPDLEVTCCPSVCFNISTQTGSAQLDFPLAWITSAPGSPPITDPIYPYMVHSVSPSPGSQVSMAFDLARSIHIGMLHTPSPAILGLPSCKRLAIVKMNCVVTVMQPGTKPPNPAPASTTATKVKPATVHAAAKSIRSTDDLIKEFPDQFTGIGRFPGKYKI